MSEGTMRDWLLERRGRIIAAGILTVSLPLVGLTIYVHHQVRSEIENTVVEENRAFFNVAVYHVKEKIDSDISSGKVMAARPDFIRALKGGDSAAIREHLMNLIANSDTVERVVVTSPRAVFLADYPADPLAVGRDFSLSNWYKGVSTGWSPYVSGLYFEETVPRRYLFAIAIPVKDSFGAVIGIIVLLPREDYLRSILAAMRIGGGFVYVVDRKGNLLYHPSYTQDRIVDFSRMPVVMKVRNGLGGIERMSDPASGETVMARYDSIKELSWGMVMQRPEKEILRPVKKITFGVSVFAGILLMLGSVVAYRGMILLYSIRRLSLRLEEQKQHEKEIKEQLQVELIERQRSEAALVESEDRYRKLVELSPDAILIHRDKRIVFANTAGAALLGRQNAVELTGTPIMEIVHPDYRDLVKERLRLAGEGETTPLAELKIVRPDGTVVDVASAGSPFTYSGKPAIMAVMHDITRSKEAERRLVRALGELESSNKELEQFASIASHDLQEPLRKISGFTELLERRYRDKLDPDADRYMEYIVDAAKRMRMLIDELLAYSRLGRGEKKYQPTDCNKVLGQVLGDMEKAIKERGALVTQDELPTLSADALQLGQVLQNLIANAVKFSGDGPPRVHISARQEGGEWIFSVRDNGIGIEPQFFPRIFVMFQRLHTQDEYPGSGIGLAVCRKIIERHGGRIWVESGAGSGSTFYFTLPARREDGHS